jgi:hypothetical protein
MARAAIQQATIACGAIAALTGSPGFFSVGQSAIEDRPA